MSKKRSTSMKLEENRGEYVILTRFGNMTEAEPLIVWYSFPYRDKKGITIQKWKDYLADKDVVFSYIKYTADHKAMKGLEAALYIYRKWPNGNYQWLTKADADFLMQGVDNYKRKVS